MFPRESVTGAGLEIKIKLGGPGIILEADRYDNFSWHETGGMGRSP
jgi:hypothetical protein